MVLVKLKWNKLTFDNVDVSVDEGVQVKRTFLEITFIALLLTISYHSQYSH